MPENTTTPSAVIITTLFDGLLWIKGIFAVLSICRINICDHIDSRNHPVWKTVIYLAIIAGSDKPSKVTPPQTEGHKMKYRNKNVNMSNAELIGPNHRGNLPDLQDPKEERCKAYHTVSSTKEAVWLS